MARSGMRRAPVLAYAGLVLLALGSLFWHFATALDLMLLGSLRLDASSHWLGAVSFLSSLGGIAVEGPIALLAMAWLLARRQPAQACWLFAAVGSGRLAVEAIKAVLVRPRPPLFDRLAEVSSHSFPSSHTAGTLLTWLALALLISRPRPRSMLIAFALAFAAAIGWTRMALGVHWFSDVVAGYGLAMLWAGVAARWLPDPAARRLNPA